MRNIMGNLYFNITALPPFKDVLGSHINWTRSPINRSYYRIYDLKLWFESDFELGEELVVKRISENGKYFFPKHHMKCF